MINWIKKQLGIETLQAQVAQLQQERQELTQKVEQEKAAREAADSELQMFRKREEANKAKYDSSEPWIEIRSADFNEARGVRIELDWNDAFVAHLKESGIKGKTDDEIVQKWLAFLYQDLVEKLEAKVIDQKDETKTVSDYA